jgi:hypothetical protein
MSQRRLALILGAAVALVLIAASGLAAAKSPQLLEFNSMVGVPQALTGAQAPIRGINGGGIPWTLTSGRGELSASGQLEIKVTGLVFAAGPNAGSNTVTSFRGLVSCLNSDGAVVNVSTDPFPATVGPATSGGGDAQIEATLTLPHPCIAPLVFVTSPGLSWFATTGG